MELGSGDAPNIVKNLVKSNGLLLYYHQYSFYSQKVLLALHEKKLPFKSHVVNLIKGEQYQPWFLQLNPRGEVPVLKDGFKIIPDSGRILEYLEDNFSNGDTPRLIPLDRGLDVRNKVEHFRTVLDQIPAGAITIGSFVHPEFCSKPKLPFIEPVRKLLQSADEKSSANLERYAEKNPEIREILLQKASSQSARHERCTKKREYKILLDHVDMILNEVEEQLSTYGNDKSEWWLCSDLFTAADVSLTVLLDRLYRLGLENYFWEDGKKPNISQYYKRVQMRESYKKTIPSTLLHLQILFHMNTPLVIGVGVVTTIAVIVGGIIYFKRH